jgi:hypothetical protein
MLIKQLTDILEGKMKQESAADAFARYEKLKKSNADPKMLANVLKIANDLMTYEMKAKIKTLDDKYSGEDWWDTVKTFYKVEERNHEWAVVSDARDWKEEKEWVYPTKYEADEQLYKLITYKVRDRKLGHGSEDKDFERAAVLAKRREPAMAEGLDPKAQAYLDKNGYRTKKTADGLVISNSSLNADERSDDGAQEKLKIVAALKKIGTPAKLGGKNNNLVILEGSWAMASTPEEITKLKNILSKPLRAKNAGKVLYNLIGDDSLFDQIDEVKSTDPEDDVKQMVLIWLKKNVPSLYKAVYHAKVAEGEVNGYLDTDPYAYRDAYKKAYMANGGGGRVPNKAASEAAYAVVEKEYGKKAVDALKKRHGVMTASATKAGNVYKESLVKEDDHRTWRDDYDEKQELAKVLAYVKKNYGGKAWFKGGSYAYLIDTSKPKELRASDGAVIKVKDILTGLEDYCDKYRVEDFINSDPDNWGDYFRPYKANRNDQADHETKNLMGEMIRMIPRGYLYETVNKEAVRALTDAKLKSMIKDFETRIGAGGDGQKALKALKDEAKRRDSAGYIED